MFMHMFLVIEGVRWGHRLQTAGCMGGSQPADRQAGNSGASEKGPVVGLFLNLVQLPLSLTLHSSTGSISSTRVRITHISLSNKVGHEKVVCLYKRNHLIS